MSLILKNLYFINNKVIKLNEKYLKTIAEKIQTELNKSDFKCYDTEIFLNSLYQGQILFSLIKNNKKYKFLQNIYDSENIELLSNSITENILLNMKYK